MSATPQDTARRRPKLALPAGATDAHCHVFGPAGRFPYASHRRYTPADAPKEALAALHDTLGIARAVIVQASCHGSDNSAMLDCLGHDRDRYRGVAIVAPETFDRDFQILNDAGVLGVRFNFVRHLGGAPDMAFFHQVMKHIAPYGWHVVLHLDAPDILPLTPMMRDLALPFVIDHMGRVDASLGVGQPAFKALLHLAQLDTCWIKVSGAERIAKPPFRDAIPFVRALIEASPQRTLWGTDFPHPNLAHPVDEADLVDLLAEVAPEPSALKRLFVDNPARLYAF